MSRLPPTGRHFSVARAAAAAAAQQQPVAGIGVGAGRAGASGGWRQCVRSPGEDSPRLRGLEEAHRYVKLS